MSANAAPLLIEGYASLFGVADMAGDVVRAGAFAASLAARGPDMLLQHRTGATVGRWVRITEDGRGLFVRGVVEAAGAARLAGASIDGLSIGFRPVLWKPHPGGGRILIRLDLVEISLVARPMLPGARFQIVSGTARAA